MADGKHVLTREFLAKEGVDWLLKGVPGVRVLSEEERRASLAGLLGERPPKGNGAWVFAYGSLIWNPVVTFAEQRFARVYGWHRSFCLSTAAGRGTPELPGLVLGLDRGGACTGAAFRIDEEPLEEELTLLWRREMVGGAYRPRWLPLRDKTGAVFARGIAFTIRRDGSGYAGGLPEEEVVHRLAHAAGQLGSSAEYLFQTCEGLRSLGIHDRLIEHLAAAVRQRRERDGAIPPP